jgi:hypothetical protein
MKKYSSAIILVLIVLLAFSAILSRNQRQQPTNGQSQISPSRIAPTIDNNANIRVSSPTANDVLSLPITIKGEARVFENQMRYRLIECDGDVLAEGVATAQSPDMGLYGPFEITVDILPDPQGKEGCIEVFSASPKDGSDINIVQLPITYDLSKARKVDVYFSTKESGNDCETVFPVKRFASSTQEIARTTLEELLRGPINREKEQGYDTTINRGVSIQNLEIENGVARVDFDKRLEEAVGGSCRVSIIRKQIEKTLLQFQTIDEVIISIDGRVEDILQP